MMRIQTGNTRGIVMGFMVFVFAMVALIFVITGFFVFSTLRSVNDAVQSATQMSSPSTPMAITTNAGGAATCDRARRCCHAYVEALHQPSMRAQLCGSVDHAQATPAADAACGAMINGWRQGLVGMQKAVPADCQ